MKETWDPITNQIIANKADRVRIPFLLADWQGPASGFYTLDLIHNLGDDKELFVTVYEGNVPSVMESYTILNENSLRIRVPAIPDMRFSGTAIVNN